MAAIFVDCSNGVASSVKRHLVALGHTVSKRPTDIVVVDGLDKLLEHRTAFCIFAATPATAYVASQKYAQEAVCAWYRIDQDGAQETLQAAIEAALEKGERE